MTAMRLRPGQVHRIAIVGVGPRGTYALERLLAVLTSDPAAWPVEIHLIEPNELGAGLVYATSQPSYLLMNTVAAQITAFPDSSVADAGPVRLGPTLYEWLHTNGVSEVKADEYPARAEHGKYLSAVIRSLLADLPAGVTVHPHQSTAVDIRQDPRGANVHLDDGDVILVDDVLLTVGNVGNQDPPVRGIPGEPDLAALERYIGNPYPVPERLAAIGESDRVGVLGLGLTSIDVIIALTVGRGGTFRRRREHEDLVYEPSGREPRILAWSRSGLPLLARARNEKGVSGQFIAEFLTLQRVRKLIGERGKLDFYTDLLPLLKQDMSRAYYEALRGREFCDALTNAMRNGTEDVVLAEVPEDQKFSWDALVDPPELCKPSFPDANDYRERLTTFLESDVEEAKRGNRSSPVKAAGDSLRDVRDSMRYAVEYGGLTAASHRRFNRDFSAINNRLSVGPPYVRVEQLLALCECGILDLFWGPSPDVSYDTGERRFEVSTTAFLEPKTSSFDYLVDGRVQVERSLLVTNLVLAGAARLAVNSDETGRYELRTLEIARNGLLIDASGDVAGNIYASGQLAEGTVWYPQVAARPGVNSRSIGEAGRWATTVRDAMLQRERISTRSEYI